MANVKIPDLPALGAVIGTTVFEVDDASGTPGASKKATAAQILSYIMAALTAGAPLLLDTLDELAAALGDDPNFAATVATQLGGKVNKSGDTMTGALNFAAVVDVASAATTNIGAAASNLVRVTGTTTITSFGSIAAGAVRIVRFAGALQLTNSANLITLSGANHLTAAGDVAVMVSEGSGVWRTLLYQQVEETSPWVAYTLNPRGSVVAGSGFTATITSARYKKIGRVCHVAFDVTITNVGTGPAASGPLIVDIPIQAQTNSIGVGRESAALGHMFQIAANGGDSFASCILYAGGATTVAGYRLRGSLTYETSS